MRAVVNYFKESWQELGKVSWPSRQQTIRLSIAVIGLSIILSIFIGLVDFGLAKVVKRVLIG